jgi:hypothetical protein
MPQMVYCWRCKTEMPMLEEVEWAQLAPLLTNMSAQIMAYRERTGATLEVARREGFEKAALEKYKDLTGYAETNINALWHHRLASYGPPCESCGKLMRTSIARFCAECGHVPSNKSLERTREG